jgi:hypothetical protein
MRGPACRRWIALRISLKPPHLTSSSVKPGKQLASRRWIAPRMSFKPRRPPSLERQGHTRGTTGGDRDRDALGKGPRAAPAPALL